MISAGNLIQKIHLKQCLTAIQRWKNKLSMCKFVKFSRRAVEDQIRLFIIDSCRNYMQSKVVQLKTNKLKNLTQKKPTHTMG